MRVRGKLRDDHSCFFDAVFIPWKWKTLLRFVAGPPLCERAWPLALCGSAEGGRGRQDSQEQQASGSGLSGRPPFLVTM